jgi:hypothetical protein
MSILTDPGLIRTDQLDSNQGNVIAHVVNKILGGLLF